LEARGDPVRFLIGQKVFGSSLIPNPILDKLGSGLEPIDFDRLPGLSRGGFLDAWRVFHRSCKAVMVETQPLRPARVFPDVWRPLYGALAEGPFPRDDEEALQLFRERFQAFIIGERERSAFFTGYYEPEVEGSLVRGDEFQEPLLERPADLESFSPDCSPLGSDLWAGRRGQDGQLEPYPRRAEIEDGALGGLAHPLVWVRDGIEAFMIHVQGSARVRLQNGALARLTYAGRNGRPYSSIGALLIKEGHVGADGMSLARLKRWVRDQGQERGEAGRALMQRNESFIFFKMNSSLSIAEGPIGAASVALSPLRSIAVDRNLWPYGLPYWLSAELPWLSTARTPFQRLLIGQDTGSAILGPARADIFFGSGDEAGARAGDIRDRGIMFVLLPREGKSP
jgi:membrane-bound lytic murein transglycosylase A